MENMWIQLLLVIISAGLIPVISTIVKIVRIIQSFEEVKKDVIENTEEIKEVKEDMENIEKRLIAVDGTLVNISANIDTVLSITHKLELKGAFDEGIRKAEKKEI